MTIASELTKLNTNLTNAYTAVNGKGGTLPASQNFDNLASCINTIVADNGISIPKEISAQGVYRQKTTSFTFSLPSNVTTIDAYALAYAFYMGSDYNGLTSVDLSSVTTIEARGLQMAFHRNFRLTSADLSSVTTVSIEGLSHTFQACKYLTNLDVSSITTVDNWGLEAAFQSCDNLTTIRLTSLTSVGSEALKNAFSYDSSLTDIYFNSLTTNSFRNVNAFANMLQYSSTGTIRKIHFPSNLSSTISGLTGYPTFGGNSDHVTLSFDLPATS